MNYKKAKEVFEKYLKKYDAHDDKIRLKIVHTYGVVACSAEIAERKKLSAEDVELAKIIALLHDIGRFEQLRRFHTFDAATMNHAAYGVKVLFEERMIEQFLPERDYDAIIKTAIAKHSDFQVEGIADERTLLHAKLIRDADKLDNCRVKLEDSIETILDVSAEQVGREPISENVYASCMKKESVRLEDRKTKMDYWISYVAYFYDLNFRETWDIVKEKQYVSRIIHRIPYSNPDTKEKVETLEKELLLYEEKMVE